MAERWKYAPALCLIVICLIITKCSGASPLFSKGTQTITTTENVKHRINLGNYNFMFPFYGSTYKDMYISTDGMIGFSSDVGYDIVQLGSPTIAVSVDKPFIAPFRFQGLGQGASLGGNAYNGRVYYRISSTNGAGNDELKNISSYIRSSVVGASNFNASWAVIVTWRDVVAYQDAFTCGNNPNTCPKNTFQAAVITDIKDSYAIFNYEQMNIQIPSNAYQAGFNGGRGRGWTQVLKTSELQTANTLSGGSMTGRFVFKISGDRMVRGGCFQRSSTGTLQMYPTFAGMFGGEMLQVSGPCLSQNDMIMCKFGDGVTARNTSGYFINTMKARCAVPRLLERGRILLSMSRDGGNTYSASTYIYIVHPSRMQKYLELPYNGKSGGWNETSPDFLTVNWYNSGLLTNATNAKVNLNLIGYRETKNQIIWKNLKTLGSSISVSAGTYRFRVRDYSCNGIDCNLFEIGYLELSLVTESQANMYRSFVKGTLPLGWFMNRAMFQRYGENWPHTKCVNWYNNDKTDMTWMNQLIHCPCNLQQAIVDVGRWQPDVGCNMFRPTSGMCEYHIGAVHCIRAVQPTASGSGNQCCYGSDGLLKFAADSFQGSTPDKSHDWGAFPYNGHDLVPTLSHWIHDVVTFYYCCLWTGYRDCDYYMDLRATRDCNGYNVPRVAMVYGQGHIKTLDNAQFRMCGQGDYILLQGQDFIIQGRFQYSALNGTQSNVTVILTNVAVQTKSETIEIRMKHPTLDRSSKLLDVLVNNSYQLFSRKELYWQDFKESAVVNTDLGQPNRESNFTIIMKNGIGIQVADKNNIMFASVFIPPNMRNQVSGIIGTWDDNKADDLMPKGSNTPVQSSDTNNLFLNFQYSWRIQGQSNSIIPHSVTVDNTTNLCTTNIQQQIRAPQCGNNMDCVFDMRITGDINAALATKSASEWFTQMRTFMQPVRSCGLLDVPRSTKNNYNYTFGSTVTVTGCRRGALSGQTTYTCASDGNNSQLWSPDVTATCAVTVEGANAGMIVGIVLGVAALIAVVVIVVVILRNKMKRNQRRSGEKYAVDNPPAAQFQQYDPAYDDIKRDGDNVEEEPKRRPSKEYSV